MKYGPHSVERDANSRAAAFAEVSAERDEERLDFTPIDVGANGIGEDGLQNGRVLSRQRHIVSFSSISKTAKESRRQICHGTKLSGKGGVLDLPRRAGDAPPALRHLLCLDHLLRLGLLGERAEHGLRLGLDQAR